MKRTKKSILVMIMAFALIGVIAIKQISKPNESQTFTQEEKEMLALYIEDSEGNYQLSNTSSFPKEGYVLDRAECKNGGVVTQDATTKKIRASISVSDTCNLYFAKEKIPSFAEQLIAKANDVSVTTYTGATGEMYTFDHPASTQTTTGWSDLDRRDYRYIGATPNNWVRFNDEDWRIIGVFTVETSAGNKEQLIKIIRNESIGNIAWDSNVVNEWPTSSLKTLLNTGDYYNKVNTHAGTGLNVTAREQIEEVKWYLGGSSTDQNLGGPDYYAFERGETVYTGRSTNTTAKVGLMYPSDYIYTYANGVDNKCYTDGYNCDTGQKTNGWLYNSSIYQWTISPRADYANRAFNAYSRGYLGFGNVYSDYGVRPVVYLKSGIKIVSGNGTSSEDAYILG